MHAHAVPLGWSALAFAGSLLRTPGRFGVLLLLLGCAWLPLQLAAQSDDFNDGNDAGWSRYSPLAPFGAGAKVSFPNGAYRIQAPASPDPQFGPARAGSLRKDVTYSDFQISVDVVAWDAALRQSIGLVARISNIGLGMTQGYTLNYNPQSGFLQMVAIVGEAPGPTIAEKQIPIAAGQPFHLVFTGTGPDFVGQMFSPDNLTVPLGSIYGQNESYQDGVCGVFVFDLNGPDPADATFDNYAATVPGPTALRATVTAASPRPGEQPEAPIDALTIDILSRATTLDTATVRLLVDGALAETTVDTSFNPAIVLHFPTTPLAPDQPHHAKLTYDDGTGVQTFEWDFGAPVKAPPTKLEFATAVTGSFAEDATALLDAPAKAFTLPLPSGNRFYRLRSDAQLKISAIRVVAGNLVISYE